MYNAVFRFIVISFTFSFFILKAELYAQAQEPPKQPPMLEAKTSIRLSGFVKDAETGEAAIDAVVSLPAFGIGVKANTYGFYSITVPNGKHLVKVEWTDYGTITDTITFVKDTTINFNITPKSAEIEAVEIEGVKNQVNNMETGVSKMDIKFIRAMPAFMGEVDVIRAIQLMPGVTTVGEGATGFNVRGGTIDQNLILQDNAPIYNSAHLLGFFSVFNPDAVKEVKLYKGGMPAQYSGRLASVLDVRLKEGNAKTYNVQGGIGTVFSRLTIEGPIVKDKCSFIVAGRRSYIDALGRAAGIEVFKENTLYFYDLSAKINYVINEKNRVFLSGYFGRDVFKFGTNFQTNWGNATGTARWNRIFSDKIFMNLTAIYSSYDYELGVPEGVNAFRWRSYIIDHALKPEFTYYINANNTLSFGANITRRNFKPGESLPLNDGSIFNPIKLDDKKAVEAGVYIDNEMKLSSRWGLQYGIHFSTFHYFGNGRVYYYKDPEKPGESKPIDHVDTVGANYLVKSFFNPEPRLTVKYQLNEHSSLKAAYNRTVQYIHLISNTTASLPFDVWTPSNNNIPPQKADQISIGYFRNSGTKYEFSVETYYKYMQNQIDYITGANLFLNDYLDGELLSGIGRAYGIEGRIQKHTGRFTGQISVTVARSERKVSEINNNEWYPNRFDQTFKFNMIGTLALGTKQKWEFNYIFVFQTGTPATFPAMRLKYEDIVVPQSLSEPRNNARIPAYHRLDISFTYKKKSTLFKKPYESEWVFGLYNAYGELAYQLWGFRNAFSIYYDQETVEKALRASQTTSAFRLSIIGSTVPAVTYNFKW